MKQLTCEMCGSTELIKQDGFFVCQTCGTKYSVEDAKKMMIEGTVDVQGVVKVDDSAKVGNYISLASTAFESKDITSAISYCDKALEIDPYNYKAWVVRARTVGFGSTLANKKVVQSIVAAKKAIELAPETEKEKIADELVVFLSLQIVGLHDLAVNLSKISLPQGLLHMKEIMNIWLSIMKLPNVSKECLRQEIELCKTMYKNSKAATSPWKRCMYASCCGEEPYWITFKRAVLPDEVSPEEANIKKGCYVATCVYGSYDCSQVWTLRRYRDNTLASTWYGRTFIRTYYAISPTLVKWFGETKWFKKMWKCKLDRMVKKLQDNGVESTPYEDKEW